MSRLGLSSTFATLAGAAFLLVPAASPAASRSSSHVSSVHSSSHTTTSRSSGSHRSSGSSSGTHTGSWSGGHHHGGSGWGGGHFHSGWGYYGGSRFYGSGWGWGWGFGPWWGFGYPYYSGYYGYGYEPRYYAGYGGGYGDPRARFAAVKTDVEPDEAALYLDGKLIGTADDFDGFPDKLYLGRGHYRLEFRLDGYETLTTEIDASPGRLFRVDQHLKKIPGSAHYGTYTPAQPEGGVIRYFEKSGSHASPADSDWRSRGTDHRATSEDDEPVAPRQRMTYEQDRDSASFDDDASASEGDDDADDDRRPADIDEPAPAEPPSALENDSRIVFDVTPADAAIYVDDRFAGSARELDGLAGGMAVSPGEHRITVTCPGYREATLRLDASTAKRAKASIQLKK